MRGNRHRHSIHFLTKAGSTLIRAIVRFDGDVPDDIQAKCLFDFEINLSERSGLDVRVFKERMKDDSKLRVIMDARRKK